MLLTADTSSVDKALETVERNFRGMRWQAFMEQEQRGLEKIHRNYFESFVGPDGKPWKANAPRTIKQKGHARQLHGIPARGFQLRQSLTLPMSQYGIRYEIDHWPLARLIFGTDAPYHGYNNDGTRWIPSRKHLGITRAYFGRLARRANSFAFKSIKRVA